MANPFLLPQSHNNTASFSDLTSELSYFSTYKPRDAVDASSLAGTVTVQDFAGGGEGSLYAWYASILNANVTAPSPGNEVSDAQPWLWLAESTNPSHVSTFFGPATVLPTGSPQNVFGGVTALLPPTLRVTADTGDVNLVGSLTLSPSPVGTVDIVAAGSVNAFLVNAVTSAGVVSTFAASSTINLSDANPDALPSVSSPLTSASKLSTIDPLFTETGATEGLPLQTRQLLHADIDDHTLHAGDFTPAYIYAGSGDISGLTFFSAKQTQVIAGQDITDVGLYIQNNSATDISLVNAGRDIVGYDASSLLREQAGTNLLGYIPTEAPLGSGAGAPNSGDIQISGPGTLEVLAGRNFTLGNDAGQTNGNVAGDGLYTGLTSIGGQRNPTLSFGGADIFAGAGLGSTLTDALQNKSVNFTAFINEFLQPGSTNADTYLPDLAAELDLTNVSNDQVWANFETLSPERQTAYALDIFYLTLRDAGRNHNVAGSPGFGNYLSGQQAIAALFPADAGTYTGNIDLTSREVKTTNGGNIGFIAPGGSLTVGVDLASGQPVDQGILTVDGGNISIFANNDVLVGTSRIFTLHGGNEVIWSSVGNIDAGASSKTVVSAPPTRVLVDPTSGAVETDLAGLSTGGGIGVLASVVGAPVGDVDLIAPLGTVNAGDAGIRASGNLNIAAEKVLNADNIAVGGAKTGTPTTTSANIGALAAASSAAGSSQAAASNGTPAHQNVAQNTDALPSIITVEVLGYGGGDQD